MVDMKELLRHALVLKASDLFVTSGKKPSFRIQDEVVIENDFPEINPETIDRFRISVIGEEGEKKYHQVHGCDASLALSGPERFRINFFTSLNGPGFVARPIRLGSSVDFVSLSLPGILMDLCKLPRGIILVTGATGSGKTTTLTAIINYINENFRKHILTIEDPIEYIHRDMNSLVTQREVDSSMPGAFSTALKFALRENPDIIVIGEMRDMETIQVAITAALTGHLVIATVHTSDSIQTVERLIGMFPETQREQLAQDFSLAVEGILSQRLVPRKDGHGMIPAVEILLGTPTVRKQIRDRDYNALDVTQKAGAAQGMITFNKALYQLYQEGMIELDDALHASGNPDELILMLKGMNIGSEASAKSASGIIGAGDSLDMKTLLRSAVKIGGSDLIITAGAPPMLRLNGMVRNLDLPPLSSEDITRLLYSIISKPQRVILEEKKELDFALNIQMPDCGSGTEMTNYRFRMNAFYQRGALAMVARVITTSIPDPESLFIPGICMKMMGKKQGLILVTGPTGSGKSTTLAALLEYVNRTRASHIITIEDPIEYMYDNKLSIVEQRELGNDTLSFAGALKAAMREAPDIILVGEIRDIDTMASALTAAETGHLVLSTMHTNSAPQTIDRIIDSFPASQQNQIRQQLSGALLGVISQRLLPRIDEPGRIAAFEIMVATPPVQALVREGKTHMLSSVIDTSTKDGMISLSKSLKILCEQEIIDPEEAKTFIVDYKTPEAY